VLVDAALPALDRDLMDASSRHGCAVLVVADPRHDRDWRGLGAAAELDPGFEPSSLVDVLAAHAAPIAGADLLAPPPTDRPEQWRGQVAAVCGSGGTGASTVAAALAQGLGSDVRHAGQVCLVDLALRAEQAMLHDARDVAPGIEDLVEAHRAGQVTRDQTRRHTFQVDERGYHLLLGLRRARGWVGVRPRAFDAAFASVTHAYRWTVCDCDADVDGEAEVGSADVQDRNHMARTALGQCDVTFVVGAPGLKGVHSLVRVIAELLDFGLAPERIVPVVNRAPRSHRARAEVGRTLAELLDGRALATATPVFVPERHVDDAFRDSTPLPSAITVPLAAACAAVAVRTPARARPSPHVPVAVGSLGHWSGTEVSG
jgi:hypothetical protein